jgi:hypothetical protein
MLWIELISLLLDYKLIDGKHFVISVPIHKVSTKKVQVK